MASRKINENYTEFGGSPTSRWGSVFSPTGKLGKWLSKFGATSAKRYYKQGDNQGDTFAQEKTIQVDQGAGGYGVDRYQLQLPETEMNRKRRYQEFEKMDEYPEVGAAFDIYADDCTQRNLHGKRWKVISKDLLVIEEIERMFNNIKLDTFYWDIVRNTCKYGDCFIETILDIKNPEAGIRRIKILNPKYILRVEDNFGYLKAFLQEVPDSMDNLGAFNINSKAQYINLDRNQIVHFRLHTSDPLFYPYGKSIAALGAKVYRSLKMMEDAMLIYRLSRAPERRIFYIETGNMPASKAENFIERVKQKYKKEKFYNSSTGNIDARYNPLSADEDYYVPIRKGSGAKIETLPGAQNLGEVDDVKYFRDKLLASLKIPKDYVVEKDKSPERKANLSQLDVKFARTIERIKRHIEVGLETIAKRHLMLKGFPVGSVHELRIELPDPSDMFTKRKIEVEEAKTRTVQAVIGLGLFDKATILKEFYGLTDQEVEEQIKKVEKEEQAEAQAQQQQAMSAGPAAPASAPQGGQPPAQQPVPNQESKLTNFLKKDAKGLQVLKRLNERSGS